jgi:glycosyltransferase involved in cell wall biosynthesis
VHLRPGGPEVGDCRLGHTLLRNTSWQSYLPVSLSGNRRIYRFVERCAPNAIHANGFGHPFVDVVARFAIASNVSTVLTVHGLPNLSIQTAGIRVAASAYLHYRRRELDEAFAVTCPTVEVSRELRFLTTRAPQVIPWGVERVPFPTRIRTRPFPALLSIGRIVPLKRLEATVRAVKEVLTRWPMVSLDIVGPTADRRYARRLSRIIRELGLQERVVLLGGLNPERCRAALDSADVFISASRQESFGLAVLEAAVQGIPTVSTDVGVAGAIVRPPHGRLVSATADHRELTGALHSLLDGHPDALAAARLAASSVANDFSWRKTVARYATLLATRPKHAAC